MRGNILVVDDNPVNVELLLHLLEDHGHTVHCALNANAALECLQRQRPDLLLLDMQMPGMDGYTLARLLKGDAATADIPIVAVTSYAMSCDRQKALDAGCDDHVTKPIDTRRLPNVVAQYLAGNRGTASASNA